MLLQTDASWVQNPVRSNDSTLCFIKVIIRLCITQSTMLHYVVYSSACLTIRSQFKIQILPVQTKINAVCKIRVCKSQVLGASPSLRYYRLHLHVLKSPVQAFVGYSNRIFRTFFQSLINSYNFYIHSIIHFFVTILMVFSSL